MGKKTPFYRWGKIQPLCSQPAQSGTTAPRSGTTARAEVPLSKTTVRRQKARRTAGAVLPLVLMVLPLDLTVLPQMVAVLLLVSGTKKYICAYHRWTCDKFLVRSGSSHGSSRGSTAPSGSTAPKGGSKKLLPLLPAVVPLQPFQNTKTTTTFANRLRIRRNQFCWKANDKG